MNTENARFRMSNWFFLILIPLLAGCSVGPDYHPPETKVPAVFAGQASGKEAVKPDPAGVQVAQWWTTLEDPVLNSLMEQAVRGNLDLRAAQARVREARARYGIERADRLPTVQASASYQRTHTSESIGVPKEFLNLEENLFQAGFDASWEIDVFGGVRRRIEAANADVAAEIENRRDVLVSLLAETARNYVELRASQRQSAIARANLEAQQETLELTRVRFSAGLASDLDVARAEALVQTTASQIPQLETAARQSIHLLSVLLGREPNALVEELSQPAPIPPAPPEVPAGLPSDLLRRRPDVRRAERQLAAATARIGVATADLFPRFSLTAAIGFQAAKFDNIADSDSGYWSIVPGVSLPVFNYGRIRSNINVQNAREEQALALYEQTVLTSLREVEDALVAYSQDQERRKTLAEAVNSNRRAVALANELYQQGLTDFLSVLQAQRDLYASEDALVQSDRSVSADVVAIYKALGGGWEIEATAGDVSPSGEPGNRIVDAAESKSR